MSSFSQFICLFYFRQKKNLSACWVTLAVLLLIKIKMASWSDVCNTWRGYFKCEGAAVRLHALSGCLNSIPCLSGRVQHTYGGNSFRLLVLWSLSKPLVPSWVLKCKSTDKSKTLSNIVPAVNHLSACWSSWSDEADRRHHFQRAVKQF